MTDLTKLNLKSNKYQVTLELVANSVDSHSYHVAIINFDAQTSFILPHAFAMSDFDKALKLGYKVRDTNIVNLFRWEVSSLIEYTARKEFMDLEDLYDREYSIELDEEGSPFNEEMPLHEFLQTDYCKRNW